MGMNSGIARVLRHPLFVEKTGGTLHIAIGSSYHECYVSKPSSKEGQAEIERLTAEGICNRSAQHVDIVTDFRPGLGGRRSRGLARRQAARGTRQHLGRALVASPA